MFKLKKLPQIKHTFKLTEARYAHDTEAHQPDYDDSYWRCDKCSILYEPSDIISYCEDLDETRCPRCKGNIWAGCKNYYKQRYELTPVAELPEPKKKRWWRSFF